MRGRVERGGHVLLAACRGPPETAGLPARAEVLRCRVGGGIHVDVGVACDDNRLSPTEAARRGIHLYVGPERRLSRPRGAACLWSVDVDEGEASPVCPCLAPGLLLKFLHRQLCRCEKYGIPVREPSRTVAAKLQHTCGLVD